MRKMGMAYHMGLNNFSCKLKLSTKRDNAANKVDPCAKLPKIKI